MRQLHPRTIEIIANNPKHPAYPISHCWSEVFKWLGNRQKHPKVFITDEYDLGVYLAYIYRVNEKTKKCNLDLDKVKKLSFQIRIGFRNTDSIMACDGDAFIPSKLQGYFNDNHLFSDACSLYYKGINIFEDLYGDDWKRYCPVISHKEIIRQCQKTINKSRRLGGNTLC